YHRRTPNRHVAESELRTQLAHYFKVLWAKGIRTSFESRDDLLARIIGNIFPRRIMHRTVKAVIEGALHSEYELRTVKKILPIGGKTKVMLTGILDVVVQQNEPIEYKRLWQWSGDSLEVGES